MVGDRVSRRGRLLESGDPEISDWRRLRDVVCSWFVVCARNKASDSSGITTTEDIIVRYANSFVWY